MYVGASCYSAEATGTSSCILRASTPLRRVLTCSFALTVKLCSKTIVLNENIHPSHRRMSHIIVGKLYR